MTETTLFKHGQRLISDSSQVKAILVYGLFIIIYKETAYNYHMPKISLNYGMWHCVESNFGLLTHVLYIEEVIGKSFINIQDKRKKESSCVNFDTERKLINAQS